MRTSIALITLLAIGSTATAFCKERDEDKKPLTVSQPTSNYQVFSAADIKQLGEHDATLRAIDLRLGGIETNTKEIKATLDSEVMPTIHVFNFLKWAFALVIGVLVAEWLKSWWSKRRPQSQATSA